MRAFDPRERLECVSKIESSQWGRSPAHALNECDRRFRSETELEALQFGFELLATFAAQSGGEISRPAVPTHARRMRARGQIGNHMRATSKRNNGLAPHLRRQGVRRKREGGQIPRYFRDRVDVSWRKNGLNIGGRPDLLVLALPRGGAPVGFEVARGHTRGSSVEIQQLR